MAMNDKRDRVEKGRIKKKWALLFTASKLIHNYCTKHINTKESVQTKEKELGTQMLSGQKID